MLSVIAIFPPFRCYPAEAEAAPEGSIRLISGKPPLVFLHHFGPAYPGRSIYAGFAAALRTAFL